MFIALKRVDASTARKTVKEQDHARFSRITYDLTTTMTLLWDHSDILGERHPVALVTVIPLFNERRLESNRVNGGDQSERH